MRGARELCGLGVLGHVLAFSLRPPAGRIPALAAMLLAVGLLHFRLPPWQQAYWRSKDPKRFVLDEVAGYLVIPILFPYGTLWQVALWGFLIFRVLDVIKIPPGHQIDRDWTGAWGILLDDIVSGLYTVGCLFALKWIGPHSGLEWLLISGFQPPPGS